ncbi:MAG: hypothetical protein RL385_6182 [Pseudomonadota bacterium]
MSRAWRGMLRNGSPFEGAHACETGASTDATPSPVKCLLGPALT